VTTTTGTADSRAPRQAGVVLRAEGLRVETPQGEPIIDDVSFHVARGEILGIVGESGSGKTTSTLALLGMAHPGASIKAGTVTMGDGTFDATDLKSISTLRGRNLSYVPQSPGTALNPVMRIDAALKEMLRRAPDSRRPPRSEWDKHLSSVLEKVGLPCTKDFLRRFPHQLSGGQQQRVCIAVALLSGADVLILDEPTTGLDVITQASVLAELDRVRKDLGLAMLYISHDLAVVSQIADRVVVMLNGSIVETGAVGDVLHTPTHEYTKRLLDATLDYRMPVSPLMKISPRSPQEHQSTQTPKAPVLLAQDLVIEHRSHGRVVASVNDVSFQIMQGKCLALLGESGSGKSTIARSVVGLKPLAAGSVQLDGADLNPQVAKRTDDQRRRLQIVFQNSSAALNPRENVRTAIERGRPRRSAEGAGERLSVVELLKLVRLPASFQHRLPRELSGGERQRVCIARALGASPDVIVCDEITSALDVSVQASVLKLLKELQRDLNLSLLFITHDMGVVSYLADDVVVLDQGCVCETGQTVDVLNSPSSPYVKRLMNAVPSIEAVH
jgi:peptide/nickel transport system ATP-binding protein